jgi:hypothetical protein
MTVLNGVASDATPDDGVAVPLAQETLTFTVARLFGTKSLLTMKDCGTWVLTIVHECEPPFVMATLAQSVWLAL